MLACAVLASPAWAVGYTSADINNAARRVTSLQEEMERSHRRMVDHWGHGAREPSRVSYGGHGWIESEFFTGLPIFVDDYVSKTQKMNLIRAFSELKYLYMGPRKEWSMGATMAGIAYGLQRPYELGDGDFGRYGADPFEKQFMEGAYLVHAHYQTYDFDFGYLISRTDTPTPESLMSSFDRVTTGEWWKGSLSGHGVTLRMRQSLLGDQPIDFFSLDAELIELLREFGTFESE